MSETIEVDVRIPMQAVRNEIIEYLGDYLLQYMPLDHPNGASVVGLTITKEEYTYMVLRWPEYVDLDIDLMLRQY